MSKQQKIKSQQSPWRMLILMGFFICLLILLVAARTAIAGTDQPSGETVSIEAQEAMQRFLADQQPPQDLAKSAFTPCVNGFAGSYPCSNVDMLAFLPLASIGGGNGNDIWGWTDQGSGREFALMGLTNGTSFVEITNPTSPVYLGRLPTHTSNSTWRDIKVYANHAFIGSEASGHGLQVFALSNLLNVSNPPVIFSNTAHYNGFGNSHNIVINEATGFLYAVGTNTCSGGLHMVNIQNPTSPTNAGCVSSDGYTHDSQCVIYTGPDTQHQGKEICFSSNEDTLTIVNVTNKATPVQLARVGYTGSAYTHQGWLTEDQQYFLLDDELDEQSFGHNTRTRVWDVRNLDAPVIIGVFDGTTAAIDHNQYIKGNYSYQSDYRAGLRILDITNVASGSLSEVAYFDVYPSSNSASFNGSWSNYPYFNSGVVVVSGIEQGLFVLQPNLGGPTPTPSPTPTNTPTPTPTNTPPPGSGPTIYVSSSTDGTAGGVSFADEDILSYNTSSGVWSMYFDGSDVGVSGDINAFDIQSDGTILISLDVAASISGLGTVDDSDIVRFTPTSLGNTTAGTFAWYFDGSDVGLTTTAENVDIAGFAPDGRLLISTTGNPGVTGLSSLTDEDIIAFTPTSLGSTTSGTWGYYFDGSDVGLSTSSSEDTNGLWVESATNNLYLSVLGSFSVTGVSGDGADIFICDPGTLGSTTTCTYSMYWDGSAHGFAGEVADAIDIVP